MIDLLERTAAASPRQRAVVTSEGEATYEQLVADARRVAAALRATGTNRFALVEPDVGVVVRVLAGAALAGAEPCQYQADLSPPEFEVQAAALEHAVVVTRRPDLAGTGKVLSPDELVGPATLEGPPPDGPQPLLIRTTGTTGTPKAARHDWRVLERTVARVRPALDQRWLLAYGPHQFAGVQVLLHVAAARATLVAPFPRQPRDGLAALLRGEVDCISATPTYWRFLLAEARGRVGELPPLAQITLGGEASSGDLLDELRRAFPAARVSQVYASTEFGSVASVSDGRPGLAVEALWSDENPGGNLQVRDGELWVRPEAGMLGYVASGAASGAEAPAGAGGEWYATGDVVEIVGDRVQFRGRTSEIVNVGGVKVHPLPVEERIAALASVAMVRVYGRPNRLTGAIVAAEVVPVGGAAGADEEDLRRQIAEAVADLPRAWQPRSIAVVDDIATRSFKTVRGTEA